MDKKKFQAAFVVMLVMILVFGHVNVVYAAKRDTSAPVVTVKVVKETSVSAYCNYSWTNVPENEGYMIRFTESDRENLSITIPAGSGSHLVRIDTSTPSPERKINFVFEIELLDPSGNVISSASDTFVFKTKSK